VLAVAQQVDVRENERRRQQPDTQENPGEAVSQPGMATVLSFREAMGLVNLPAPIRNPPF
jgi:hypothetical protein